MSRVPAALKRQVHERAAAVCEYCGVPESITFSVHEVDHVIALKHGGETNEENLALSCTICNQHKGTDIASIDPVTGAIVPLYHPRRDSWTDHFEIREHHIEGKTPVGRTTARLLQWNRRDRVAERVALDRAGLLRVGPPAQP